MKHKILVVEDDKGINNAIKIYLENVDYEVVQAFNGKEALDLNLDEVHLAIVDIMMPIMDGFEFTMKVREKYDFPIIFLSAKSEDIDKITGLNLGADDYVTKPFKSQVLIARVKSNLRRYDQILNLRASDNDLNKIVIKDLVLDRDRKCVSLFDNEIKLTAKEYQILELLMSNKGKVFSADEIYENVWKESAVSSETVMVHVRKLREKIEVDPSKPQYLKVVWGLGYKMEG